MPRRYHGLLIALVASPDSSSLRFGDVHDQFRACETAERSCGWGRISGSPRRSSKWKSMKGGCLNGRDSVCVVDGGGNIVFECKTSSQPTRCRNVFAQRHPMLRALCLKQTRSPAGCGTNSGVETSALFPGCATCPRCTVDACQQDRSQRRARPRRTRPDGLA